MSAATRPAPGPRLTALLRRAAADLRAPDYPVRGQPGPDPQAAYPVDMSVVTRGLRTGPDGVVLITDPGGLRYHNPASVSLYALGQYALAGAARHRFLAQARYLRASQDPSGGWRYPVPVPRYGVAPGWYSAMAQGLAVSVLLRAAALTGEASYRDAAAGAVGLLLAPAGAGGCSSYDAAGRPFPEECPADPPAHILNGAVFALLGLAEYAAVPLPAPGGTVPGQAAGRRRDPPGTVPVGLAAERMTQRLAAALPGYDLGYWSRYDLRFRVPATLAYHCLHISLLRLAGQFFPGYGFGTAAARWAVQRRRPASRARAAAGKAGFVLRERAHGAPDARP